MIRFPNTLAFRLTIRYALAFVVFLMAGLVLLYSAIEVILDEKMDEDLEEDVEEFRILYEQEGVERVKREIDREVKSDEQADLFIRLLDGSGRQLFASDMTNWEKLKHDKRAFQHAVTEEPFLYTVELVDHEYPARIIYGALGDDIVLQLGESLEEKEEMLRIILEIYAVVFILAIPLASFLSWFMAKRVVWGIEQVSRTAAEIERGQLDKRVEITGQGDEIQNLANTFNSMLDRIRILVAEMREMTDNIAHDLRGPLARIRAIAEVGISTQKSPEEYQTAAADTVEECDRLLQMINATLDVAEAEAGLSSSTIDDVNFSELVSDACELYQPVAEEKQISLACNIDSGCHLRGHIQNLQRMLSNIVDNAFKYTPAKGTINVELRCTQELLTVSVADTGPGIPETDQPRIFERFFRCDQSRSEDGCGLGLSFSRAVARVHGGDIKVESNPGWGSKFTITFPLAK